MATSMLTNGVSSDLFVSNDENLEKIETQENSEETLIDEEKNIIPGSHDIDDTVSLNDDTPDDHDDNENMNTFECLICDKSFIEQSDSETEKTKQLRQHLLKVHFETDLKSLLDSSSCESGGERDKSMKCIQCDADTFESQEELISHLVHDHMFIDLWIQQDPDLVQQKRSQWTENSQQSKKVEEKREDGKSSSLCAICQASDCSTEHLACHFVDELISVVQTFPDPKSCNKCSFTSEDMINVAFHLACKHNFLEQFTSDVSKVEEKRQEFVNNNNGVSGGEEEDDYDIDDLDNTVDNLLILDQRQTSSVCCPVCQREQSDIKLHLLDAHLMDEMKEIVDSFTDTLVCEICDKTFEESDDMLTHVAIDHNKIADLINDSDLLKMKQDEFEQQKSQVSSSEQLLTTNSIPCNKQILNTQNDINISVTTRVCQVCRKSLNDDENIDAHAAQHFLPELFKLIEPQLSKIELVEHTGADGENVISAKCLLSNCDFMCNTATASSDEEEGAEFGGLSSQYLIHIGDTHRRIQPLLGDKTLVEQKRRLHLLQHDIPEWEGTSASGSPSSLSNHCSICLIEFNPSQDRRQHLVIHFHEEIRVGTSANSETLTCSECDHVGEKMFTLLSHIGLEHGYLDLFMDDPDIVRSKRVECFLKKEQKMAKSYNAKQQLLAGGLDSDSNICPVCDMKIPNREHLARHFMDEIRKHMRQTYPPGQSFNTCNQCHYKSDRVKNVAIHIALCHGQLREFLSRPGLLETKRQIVQAQPRTDIFHINQCPVCFVPLTGSQLKFHVTTHFHKELRQIVEKFPDSTKCMDCSFTCPSVEKMMKHCALAHGQLDKLMTDTELIKFKVEEYKLCPPVKKKKVVTTTSIVNPPVVTNNNVNGHRGRVNGGGGGCMNNGAMVNGNGVGKSILPFPCVVCKISNPTREHIASHFLEELNEMVRQLSQDARTCFKCDFKSSNIQNVSIHMAVDHDLLQICLADQQLVDEKIEQNKSKRPTNLAYQPISLEFATHCVICEIPLLDFENLESREVHVLSHFIDELRMEVSAFADCTSCPKCDDYTDCQVENMVKHLAISHGRLNELLQDSFLIASKRAMAKKKLKKIFIGSTCPICFFHFVKSNNRDHVCLHFMDEFREHIREQAERTNTQVDNDGFPVGLTCSICPYKTDRKENLAKHYALGHSKLDELLLDQELIEIKIEVEKVKKQIAPNLSLCPVCRIKIREKDHIMTHFVEELAEEATKLTATCSDGSSFKCKRCGSFKCQDMDKMIRHVALYHGKLDKLIVKCDFSQFAPAPASFGGGNSHHNGSSFAAATQGHPTTTRKFSLPQLQMSTNIGGSGVGGRIAATNIWKDATQSSSRGGGISSHSPPPPLLAANRSTNFNVDNPDSNVLKPQVLETGMCTICERVKFTREHVTLHFKHELNELITRKSVAPHNSCYLCPFKSDIKDILLNHLALDHNKIESLLAIAPIVAKKRKMFVVAEEVNTSSDTKKLKSMDDSNTTPQQTQKVSANVNNTKHLNGGSVTITSVSMKQKNFEKKTFNNNNNVNSRSGGSMPVKVSSAGPSSSNHEIFSHHQNNIRNLIMMAMKVKSEASMNGASKPNYSTNSRASPNLLKLENDSELEIVDEEEEEEEGGGESCDELDDSDEDQMNVLRNGQSSMLQADVTCFCDVCGREVRLHDEQKCVEAASNETEVAENDILNEFLKSVDSCPLCKVNSNELIGGLTREHLARHFIPKLLNIIHVTRQQQKQQQEEGQGQEETENDDTKDDNVCCPHCTNFSSTTSSPPPPSPYMASSTTNLAIHVALAHGQLQICLIDSPLFRAKLTQFEDGSTQNQTVVDNAIELDESMLYQKCPICDTDLSKTTSPQSAKIHITFHFLPYLRELMKPIPNHLSGQIGGGGPYGEGVRACPEPNCQFKSSKIEYMSRHYSIDHGRLRDILADDNLVNDARQRLRIRREASRSNSHLASLDSASPSNMTRNAHSAELIANNNNNSSMAFETFKNLLGQNKKFGVMNSNIQLQLKQHLQNSSSQQRSNTQLHQQQQQNMSPRGGAAFAASLMQGGGAPSSAAAASFHHQSRHPQFTIYESQKSKTPELPYTETCPICGYVQAPKSHIIRHFFDDLLLSCCANPSQLGRDGSAGFHILNNNGGDMSSTTQLQCSECSFMASSTFEMSKHVGYEHDFYLRTLVQNDEFVRQKKMDIISRPRKLAIGDECPVCGISLAKRDSRAHVVWHFMEELKEIVTSWPDPGTCAICNYKNHRLGKMGKHLGLGHSMLDELLQDKDLVCRRRNLINL